MKLMAVRHNLRAKMGIRLYSSKVVLENESSFFLGDSEVLFVLYFNKQHQ